VTRGRDRRPCSTTVVNDREPRRALPTVTAGT